LQNPGALPAEQALDLAEAAQLLQLSQIFCGS
jgi:hypothetical protein